MPEYIIPAIYLAILAIANLSSGQARNVVGFHLGPGGDSNGIDTYLRQLDSARIPFSIKNVDEFGEHLQLAVQLKQASGINHTIIWRSTNCDVPPYTLEPTDAAAQHWTKVISNMPSELPQYKDHVWLEVINEPDQTKCAWLSNFSLAISQLAIQEGWSIFNYGWSTGTPYINAGGGPSCWKDPATVAFLRWAATQNGRVGIALHEYANTLQIDNEWPYLLGRYSFLMEACDDLGIPRPLVAFTEWGWTGCDVKLPPASGIQDIDLIRRGKGQWSYEHTPEIVAAMMWYLGPWSCPVAAKADQLVLPVANYTVHTAEEELRRPHG